MTLTAAQIEGLAGYSDQASNPDIISFKAIVTDKAGNSTTHAVSNTTLTVDETPPSAFTVDTVFTVGGEICWDDANETSCYWNEDNTSITVQVPIANDATLENGFLANLAEADGTYEKIGPGSRRMVLFMHIVRLSFRLLVNAAIKRLDTNPSSDLGIKKPSPLMVNRIKMS